MHGRVTSLLTENHRTQHQKIAKEVSSATKTRRFAGFTILASSITSGGKEYKLSTSEIEWFRVLKEWKTDHLARYSARQLVASPALLLASSKLRQLFARQSLWLRRSHQLRQKSALLDLSFAKTLLRHSLARPDSVFCQLVYLVNHFSFTNQSC